MKQRLLTFFFIMLVTCCNLKAQETKGFVLRGRVVEEGTEAPIANVTLTLEQNNQSVTTDEAGRFYFQNLQRGEDRLLLKSAQIQSKEIIVKIDGDTDLGDIVVVGLEANRELNNALVGMISEELVEDDFESAVQGVSPTLILSNDPYLSLAAFQLFPFRFRVRGYDNTRQRTYINGVLFNDQQRGVFNFAAIGALNDVTRSGTVINNNLTGDFSFGALGGAENINMRAANYARGGKVTASYTNRGAYYARLMATYATGLLDNGWAFAGSVGSRYADEGALPGTSYRNLSYFFAAEKQWNNGEHSLSFATFGSPVVRGMQGGTFQEIADLVDDNLYSPNWGYQNGQMRNSRMVDAFDPTAILSHIWRIDESTNLTTGLGFHYARYGNSALNWFNAADPRPDYYRYIPSYHSNSPDDLALYTALWEARDPAVTQVDWDAMYRANMLNVFYGNGRASYMQQERRSDLYETSLNSTLNKQWSNNSKLTAGIGARHTRSHQFNTVKDLLGASYVLDVDRFAENDFRGNEDIIQNDLQNPNRQVVEGDRFEYDYDTYINSANLWLVNEHTGSLLDFYYGTRLTYTGFQRNGYMQNGRFPTESLGRGRKHDFVDYSFKAGMVYKINGRHFFSVNSNYMTEAPLSNDAYISPRFRDAAVAGLESGKVFASDLNYNYSSIKLAARVSLFQTNFYDQVERATYFDDVQRTFINHALTDVNTVHRGAEIGFVYNINSSWAINAMGTWSENYYSSNPMGTIDAENGLFNNVQEMVYMKNYYVGGIPQTAGVFGVRYFHNYWFFNVFVNGFDRTYVQLAPIRRLQSNVAGLNPNDENDWLAYQQLTTQERFAGGYTLDLSVSKILYLRNRNALNFQLMANNILNNTNLRTGGFEQGRLGRFTSTTTWDFPPRYFYAQGANVFLNMSYRF